MSWRDRLREASFRGAPFQVDGHEHGFGRRVDTHEYANRAEPWVEDLGRESRTYSLDAYVIGPDYDRSRDALIAALETAGPGTLVHPWLGVLTVACTTSSLRETITAGGEAGFRLEFVETGPNTAPEIGEDTTDAALDAASAARAEAADGLASGFSVLSQPGQVLAAAGELVGSAADGFEALAGRLTGRGAALADFLRQSEALRSQALDLAQRPSELAAGLIGTLRQAVALAATPRAALAALAPLLSFGSTLSSVAGLTPSRARQADNQIRLVRTVRQAAAAEAVEFAADITFVAYDDAVQVRDQLADAIDAVAIEAADAGDDSGWRAMEALRQAMVRDVTARGGSLERVSAYVVPAALPLLVIAQDLYGDDPARLTERAADLAARNRVRHPGFITRGTALQALSVTGGVDGR